MFRGRMLLVLHATIFFSSESMEGEKKLFVFGLFFFFLSCPCIGGSEGINHLMSDLPLPRPTPSIGPLFDELYLQLELHRDVSAGGRQLMVL